MPNQLPDFIDLLTRQPVMGEPNTGFDQLLPVLEVALGLSPGVTKDKAQSKRTLKSVVPGEQDPLAELVKKLMGTTAPKDPVGGFMDPNTMFRNMAAPFSNMTGGPVQWLGGMPGNLAEGYNKVAGIAAINNALTALANSQQQQQPQLDPMAAQLLMMILASGGL